jgi:hypothetical protein
VSAYVIPPGEYLGTLWADAVDEAWALAAQCGVDYGTWREQDQFKRFACGVTVEAYDALRRAGAQVVDWTEAALQHAFATDDYARITQIMEYRQKWAAMGSLTVPSRTVTLGRP